MDGSKARSHVNAGIIVLIVLAAWPHVEGRPLLRGKQQLDADHPSQQRLLLSEHRGHGSHRSSARHQHVEDFVSASAAGVAPAQLPGVGLPGIGVGAGIGTALGTTGAVVAGIDYGVGVGTQLLAPIVNGIASNVPLMVPAMPNGQCLRGSPVPIPQLNRVMCVVGSGAQVTNYLFNAANILVDAAARGVSLVGQYRG